MSRYLRTIGKTTVSVAICDRCRLKVALADLMADGDSPGLRVCVKCCDTRDPYKLAPRRDERLVPPNIRPEEPLS